MIKLEEIFADFQYIGHKVIKFNFLYPNQKYEETDVKYEFDYEIMHAEVREDHNFGIIHFTTSIFLESEEIGERIDFIDCVLECAFICNPEVFEFEKFQEMLSLNGLVTASQVMRTHIMNTTIMAGLDETISIPMINILELKKKKEELEDKARKKKTKKVSKI